MKNDVKLLKFKRGPVVREVWEVFEVWHFDYWYLKWIHKKSDGMVNLFFYRKSNIKMPIISKILKI